MGSISLPVAGMVAAGADAGAAVGTTAAVVAPAAAAVPAAAGATAAAAGTAAAASGSVFTLANVSTAASLIGGAASAYGQHQAGVATANEANDKARQAGLEAGQKQIGIRQNMLKALASQNAGAGAGGIGTGGSFGANVNRQITQNQSDLLALSADTSAQQSMYGQQASNAITTGNIKAGASLLDTAGKLL